MTGIILNILSQPEKPLCASTQLPSVLSACTAVPAKVGGSTTGQQLVRSNRWGWNVDSTSACVCTQYSVVSFHAIVSGWGASFES